MLQVMSSLERQVHDYSNKENKMETVVKESKIKVEESLRQRDQVNNKFYYLLFFKL